MQLQPHIANLQEAITNAAALGDEKTKATAAALADAIAPAATLAIWEAARELVEEIDGELPDAHISVHLRDGGVVPEVAPIAEEVIEEEASAADDLAATFTQMGDAFSEMGGDISRVTLRLVDQLKGMAENAASQRGVSLNSWVSDAVANALRDQTMGRRDFPFGPPRGRRGFGPGPFTGFDVRPTGHGEGHGHGHGEGHECQCGGHGHGGHGPGHEHHHGEDNHKGEAQAKPKQDPETPEEPKDDPKPEA
jgi:hypothetical protein